MHPPLHTPAQEPCAIPSEACAAIVPVTPAYPIATTTAPPPHSHAPSQAASSQDLNHRYGQLQQQTVQQCHSMAASIHGHSAILDTIGDQSLRSWYNCGAAASHTRQQAFAALDRATTIDAEIAQINHSIQDKLQQFDAQLKASSHTLRQEVAVKVEQYHRHIQQQASHCRNRLNLDEHDQPAWTSAHRNQAQRMFQSTRLR